MGETFYDVNGVSILVEKWHVGQDVRLIFGDGWYIVLQNEELELFRAAIVGGGYVKSDHRAMIIESDETTKITLYPKTSVGKVTISKEVQARILEIVDTALRQERLKTNVSYEVKRRKLVVQELDGLDISNL